MNHTPLYQETLRKIGRNVVELQKLEAMLKELLVSIEYEGEASELKERETDRRNSVSRRTMGTVGSELFEKLFSEPVEPESEPAETEEVVVPVKQWVSFQYRHGGEEYVEGINKSFEEIVEERNQLIHHRLLEFDPGVEGSCKQLISYLDAQHERIAPLREFLREELKAVFDMKGILPGLLNQLNSKGKKEGQTE